MFCEKRCSLKFRKFHRKTLVPESLSNKVQARSLQLYQKRGSCTGVFQEYSFQEYF